MSSRRVFISYSHADYTVVQTIAASLNIPADIVWVDRNFIKPGDVWRDQIQKALKRSYCVILFASPTSVQSSEVKMEIDYALQLRKRIVPVIISPCELPYQVSNLHHINLTDQNAETVRVFRDVFTGISKQQKKTATLHPRAVNIVKEVKSSNSFYNTMIVPHKFLYTSTLASISLLIFLALVLNIQRNARKNDNKITGSLDSVTSKDAQPTGNDSVSSIIDSVTSTAPNDFIAQTDKNSRKDSLRHIPTRKDSTTTPSKIPKVEDIKEHITHNDIDNDEENAKDLPPLENKPVPFSHLQSVMIYNSNTDIIISKNPTVLRQNNSITIAINLHPKRKKYARQITIRFDEKFADEDRLYPGQFFVYTNSETVPVNDEKFKVAYIELSVRKIKIVLATRSLLLE